MSGWFSRKKKKKKKERSLTSDDWDEMVRMSQHFKEEEIKLSARSERLRKKKARLEALGIVIDESTSEPDVEVRPFMMDDPGDSDMKQMMMKMKLKFKEEKIKLDRLEKKLDALEKAYNGALKEFG
jgi:hypothetical protein